MEVKLESLVPYEKIKTDSDSVFEIVEKYGKAVLLKENQPTYIIIKYDSSMDSIEKLINAGTQKHTLHEAMKIVLIEAENNTMHAAALADQIFNQGLYFQKNGGKAQYHQIRARCGHYPDMFETFPGNMIKLKKGIIK